MSPSPYIQIYERSRQEQPDESFADAIGWYLENGFVFSTPDYFVMGMPVRRSEIERGLPPINSRRGPGLDDCWYIHAMAGNLARVWDALPYSSFGWIAFRREGKLTIRALEVLRKHCVRDPSDEAQLNPPPVKFNELSGRTYSEGWAHARNP